MYPFELFIKLKGVKHKSGIQSWLKSLFNDPILLLLLKNCQLTKIQLETLLIDILADKYIGKHTVYESKAKFRLIKSGVSRGSFNRTLSQARKNVTKSIYTILILGYIGILDTPNLQPYITISNKLRDYQDTFRDIINDKRLSKEYLRVIKILQKEIENTLKELTKPQSMSNRT
jgi:hypothetical protein